MQKDLQAVTQSDRKSVAWRLRSEISAWGSINRFQQEMEDLGVRGASRPSINSYLHGRTRPSVRFLESAASVLGVRSAWLISGEGGRTIEETQFAARIEAELEGRLERFEQWIRERFSNYDALRPYVKITAFYTYSAISSQHFAHVQAREHNVEMPGRTFRRLHKETARWMGDFFQAGVESFGKGNIQLVAEWSPFLDTYVLNACAALQNLIAISVQTLRHNKPQAIAKRSSQS